MYQAAIVEDEEQVLNYLNISLLESFHKQNISIAFDLFSSGASFLHMFEAHYNYDIVFLDIEMPGIDGMEVCRKIRGIAPDTLVVFISNKESLVFQTFELQPFRFIRKSHFKASLPSLTNALIQELNSRKKQMIFFREPLSDDVYSFDCNLITYVEAERKNAGL